MARVKEPRIGAVEALSFVLGGYLGIFFAYSLQKIADAHAAFDELSNVAMAYEPYSNIGPSAYEVYRWSLIVILTTGLGFVALGIFIFVVPRLLPSGSKLRSAFMILAILQFFALPLLPVMSALTPPNSTAIAWAGSSNLTKSAVPTADFIRGSIDLDTLSNFVLFMGDYLRAVIAALVTTMLVLSSFVLLWNVKSAKLRLSASSLLLLSAIVLVMFVSPYFARAIPDSFTIEISVTVALYGTSGNILESFTPPSWSALYTLMQHGFNLLFNDGPWVVWAAYSIYGGILWIRRRRHTAATQKKIDSSSPSSLPS